MLDLSCGVKCIPAGDGGVSRHRQPLFTHGWARIARLQNITGQGDVLADHTQPERGICPDDDMGLPVYCTSGAY